ncbi:MAG: protein-L-isoaspartate O-methyltransferase [Alphaproteobacteria bacterium]|nr:protein-L-isoaspartate O-methyltransferase [Alphaproteobacteria bacterium]MBV8548157.1 protein-L-isoaspartate O-methyltransferase [Alphaproteobacteria bacterium]
MTALSLKSPDYNAARKNMVESQLRPNKVKVEPVLEVFETLPRERFVPTALAGVAYADDNLTIAAGRVLLQPMVLARIVQASPVSKSDIVLEIGTGTGYLTAVLARFVTQVVSVESDADLARQAAKNLADSGVTNAEIISATMAEGYAARAPYDGIVINGAVEQIPDSLIHQVKEGGYLLCILRHYGAGHAAHQAEAVLYTKTGAGLSGLSLFDATAPILPGFAKPHSFTF